MIPSLLNPGVQVSESYPSVASQRLPHKNLTPKHSMTIKLVLFASGTRTGRIRRGSGIIYLGQGTSV